MSFITKTYFWPKSDDEAVAHDQKLTAGQRMELNGTLATATKMAGVTPQGSIDFPGISRNLIITAASSVSATFKVTGIRNGQQVQEEMILISTTVTSRNFFDTVTDIICTTGSSNINIKVGTGLLGCTRPIRINSFITNTPVSTAIHTIVSGAISYSVIGSIEEWYNTDNSVFSIFTTPRPIYLNQGTKNSISGQFLTPGSADESSFITTEGLPLTMVCVNIVAGNATGESKIVITTPRLTA